MNHEPMTFIATNDLAGQTRGRAVPASRATSAHRRGVGWVPANLAISSFGNIVVPNAFGSTGDLRLMPDASTRTHLPASEDHAAVDLYLADQRLLDGTPWPSCPRTFARSAAADFTAETGLEVVASFEHEFMLEDLDTSGPFSWQRFRDAEPFGSELVALLELNGFAPETWLPEYGDRQFEITVEPTPAVLAADRAILLRELVRDLARRHGHRATFAPLTDPDGSGNGVHIHLSLRDASTGEAGLYDADEPSGLSALGRRFAAGILSHARAITALTAPSPASFLRLAPHRWSAGGIFLAERNREALLRICPTMPGADIAAQYNLEFRACDATANPWLAVGTLIRAGLHGITQGYDDPRIWPEDTGDELAGVEPLPADLPEALTALREDTAVSRWFDPDLLETFLLIKQNEIEATAGLDPAALCRRIADVH